MLHALRTDEGVRDFSNGLRFSLYHDHLQTIVVIQMHVESGENVVVVVVLQIGQPFAQKPYMMIID